MNKFMFAAIILFSVLTTFLSGQSKIKTEANAEIVEYTNRDGLPSSNFSNIIQTNDGYLWISGIEGTYRFDGYEFEEVDAKNSLNKMQAIHYDSTKNILYFASPEKFAIYDGKEFKYFGKDEGYKINGLAGQTVSFIRADSKGRVWVGSQTPFVDEEFNGGITKFENEEFTVYDSLSFPLHNATGFIETPYGDLIFSSSGRNTRTKEDAYIALYKNEKFTRIDEAMGINLKYATFGNRDMNRIIDEDGNTWVAMSGIQKFGDEVTILESGVLMYDGNLFHQYSGFENLLDTHLGIFSVHYNRFDNKVYASAYQPKYETFSKKNKMIFELKNERWIKSDFIEKIGSIKNLKTEKSLIDFKYLSSVFIDKNRFSPELFGFIVYNRLGGQVTKYPSQYFAYQNNHWQKVDAFSGIPIKELNDGLLLNTLNGFGIYYPKDYKLFTEREGMLYPDSFIPTFYSDNNGIVWITYSLGNLPTYFSANNKGVNIWDGETLHSITEKNGLSDNSAFNVLQDSKGQIWITTKKGVTLCREIQNSKGEWLFKFEKIKSNKSTNYNSVELLETSTGDIYTWQTSVGSTLGDYKSKFYLGKFDGEFFFEIPTPFENKLNNFDFQFIKLRETPNGSLILEGRFSDKLNGLTTAKTHVMVFDGKEWATAPESWKIPEEQIHYVGTLNNGMYYLTVNGFYNFNGERFINLIDSVDTNADFRLLKGASVAGTRTDNQADGKLFIRLRNKGLVIFDGTNLNFYTKKDGLPSANLYNPTPDNKGNMMFSHPSGALIVRDNKFQPYYDEGNDLTGGSNVATLDGKGNLVMHYKGFGLLIKKQNHKSYPLKLSSVIIDTSYYYNNFPNNLSYMENSFIFNFAALNYNDPQGTNYECMLEGYDNEWSRPGDLPFAQYQNLPSGSYVFRVKGITSNGSKTNEASYSFVIAPPFWKTWWAYSFYLLLLLLIIFSIRKYEQRRMRLKEVIKIRKEKTESRIRESSLRAEAAELQAKVAETQSRAIQAENDRQSKELEDARQLQLSMLPKEVPQLGNLDIAVHIQTATEVGGDYYDFHIHPDGTLTVILGDATGHGMQAGMMVSIMKSLFMADRSSKELTLFFNNCNCTLNDMRLGRLMMALNCVQFKDKKAYIINAGMPPVYIYKQNKNIIEEILLESLPLGAMSKTNYEFKTLPLETSDLILLMSDGLPELMNKKNEMYSYERAKTEFLSVCKKNPKQIVEHLKNSASEWVHGKDPDDDVTFVVIKVK